MSDSIVKGLYVVYDVVARQPISTFHSDNDEKAVRDCSYRVHLAAPLTDLFLYRVGNIVYNSDNRYDFTVSTLAKPKHIEWSSYDMVVDAPNLASAKSPQEAHKMFKEHLSDVSKAQRKILEEESGFVK